MKLEAKVRTSIGTREVVAEAPTYAAAKARIDQQLEAGEYLLSYRRVED